MSKQPTRNRRRSPVGKPASARRGPVAARRSSKRRRRWIGFGAAGALLAVVVALIAVASTHKSPSSAPPASSVAAVAPDGSFTTVSGTTQTVSGLRGRPTLLWFVATWCSSCQVGTEAMASQIGAFAAHGVRVVELEMADDLGQAGLSIADFGRQSAGAAYSNADWTWGEASTALTTTYDPASYLDIYYLIDSSGHIVYVNSSPGSTMGQLLAEVAKVSTPARDG